MEKRQKLFREIGSYVLLFGVAALLALVVNRSVIVNAEIPSESMEPTVMTGDRILASRLSYRFGEPERGDIIMFHYPDNEDEDYLKRIIGLPGETVVIKDGRIYLDGSGEPLAEEYLTEEPEGDFGPYEVPADCYFVLGDNRSVSWDSRYWDNTYVKREKIVGKAVFRYYPKLGVLSGK